VSEGVNITSDHLPAIYVLQQALGGTAFVQNGLNRSSKLYKAASSVTGQAFAVSTVSLALVLYSRVKDLLTVFEDHLCCNSYI